MESKDLIRQTFKLIEYFQQYEKEGIKFNFSIKKSRFIRLEKENGSILFHDKYSRNNKVNSEMTERFYNRRLEARKLLFTELDFIKKELKFLNTFDEEIKDEYEAQFYPYDKFLKERRQVLKSSKKPKAEAETEEPKVRIKPKSFKEIFTETDWEKYINALHKVENPLIDKKYNYIGKARKDKGVICSWIKHLQDRGVITKSLSRQTLAAVLNKEIKGFNLGEDGKTFDNISQTFDKEYKANLETLIN